MKVNQQQLIFLRKLEWESETRPDSDLSGYLYLYKERISSMIVFKNYGYDDKVWLNEIGRYYKKFILDDISIKR